MRTGAARGFASSNLFVEIKMKVKITRAINSGPFAAFVVILFCGASGLAFFSDDRIGATIGNRGYSCFESASVALSGILQPWIFPLWWISEMIAAGFDAFGFRAGAGVAKNVVPSFASAVILYFVLRRATRSFPRVSQFIMCVLLVCACGDTIAFVGDMKALKELPKVEGDRHA